MTNLPPEENVPAALPTDSALNLASPTKTVPMWEGITPRWLLQFLPWVEVKAGVYKINRVAYPTRCMSEHEEGTALPSTHAAYEEEPEEVRITPIQTTVNIHTRVADLYSVPHDQTSEQIRLAVAAIKEEKEHVLINSPDFGLLTVAERYGRQVVSGDGPPTPDAMDELLSRVWKWPAFFLAHPYAIAAFGRETTRLGIRLEAVEIFGVPFATWRGVPIVPSNKIPYGPRHEKTYGYDNPGEGGETSVLLLRVGEELQGVIGLHQAGIGTADLQSLTVRRMGITREGVESYLITCYAAVAVLARDAVAVLKARI